MSYFLNRLCVADATRALKMTRKSAKFASVFDPSCLCITFGDFNFPKINCDTCLCLDDQVHKTFVEFCIYAGYKQCVDFATNGKIFWTSYWLIIISNVDGCLPPIGCSDHAIVKYSTLCLKKKGPPVNSL